MFRLGCVVTGDTVQVMQKRFYHIAYQIAQTLRGFYWRVAKPRVYGAKLVVFNTQQQILLIRHSYGRSDLFMLPGGGIGRGETPDQAARRELMEEVGCRADTLRLVGEYVDTSKGARNHVSVFAATTTDTPKIDGREIVEARFFSADNIPDNASLASRNRIAEALGEKNVDGRW